MKNEPIFQVFGNFGVSIDGQILSDETILFENGEFWEESLLDVENPYLSNTQEFFEWEKLKERILGTNLCIEELLNNSEDAEIIIIEL